MKTIDYTKALSWYVNDKKFWPTVLLISLYILSCIIVLPIIYVGPVLMGYSLKLIRNIQEGKYEIPELDSSYWKEGALILLVSFAVSMVVGIVVGGLVTISHIIAQVIRDYSHTLGSLLRLGSQLLGFVLQMISSMVFPIISFAAYAIYAKTSSLNSIFTIDNYVRLWENNKWNMVIAYVVYLAAVSALGTIGFLACCIGILPAMAASMFIMAGFSGQLETKGIN